MSEITSLSSYERWDGEVPGDHQFSTIESFASDPENKGHALFKRAKAKILSDWHGQQFVGLHLRGKPGTGKSHAAIALARALHDDGAEIHYRYVPDLSPHDQGVQAWTKPRLLEPVYSTGATTTQITARREEDGKEITETTLSRGADDKIVKRERESVFPSYFDKGLERNPRTVLLLDDYKPKWRNSVRAAIEAASNASGLVIVTSNFGSIYDLAAPGEDDMQRHAHFGYGTPDSEANAQRQARIAESEALTNAMMSRMVAGFLDIEFVGEDIRRQDGFWTDMIDPSDFTA